MTIAAVSSLLGIPVPTIRSWERRYGFPVPARTQGKHRRYSVDEIDQLRMMRDEITRGHSAREAVDIVQAATRPRTGPAPSCSIGSSRRRCGSTPPSSARS